MTAPAWATMTMNLWIGIVIREGSKPILRCIKADPQSAFFVTDSRGLSDCAGQLSKLCC